MFKDLKIYLRYIRIRLAGKKDGELLMSEIANIATKNWVEREDGTPNLTEKQLSLAIKRALIKKEINFN